MSTLPNLLMGRGICHSSSLFFKSGLKFYFFRTLLFSEKYTINIVEDKLRISGGEEDEE